jgi:NTP pyrophosphatase (non-canonical NTP hydrolase)
MNDEQTSLAELKRRMADFVARRQWGKYHRPKNLAMSLAIETAELMEHFQWLTHEEADELLRQDRLRKQVADEMADVLAFLLSLANCMKLDLSAAFERKMLKNERKYPAEKVKGRYQRPKRRRT